MNKTEILNYFGGTVKTAKALCISHVAVVKWDEANPPRGRQYQIEILTNGALKAS